MPYLLPPPRDTAAPWLSCRTPLSKCYFLQQQMAYQPVIDKQTTCWVKMLQLITVCILYCGLSGLGSSTRRGGGVIALCSWARHCTLTVPLSTKVCKCIPANWWGNLTECWGYPCDGVEMEWSAATPCYSNQRVLTLLGLKRFITAPCTKCISNSSKWQGFINHGKYSNSVWYGKSNQIKK